MGKNSDIAWTTHTFNPWWGCVKCARGCKSCYAGSLAARWKYDVWGKNKPRRLFGDKHWTKPIHWNEEAKRSKERPRVFSGSMCDVFETHAILEWEDALNEERLKLWNLIRQTRAMDWLLLTKRPENIWKYEPDSGYPKNIWFGVSASDQNDLIPQWSMLDSATHYYFSMLFLSLEPLLGPIDLDVLESVDAGDEEHDWWTQEPDWVLIGCESNGPRLGSLGDFESEEAWIAGAESIVKQCKQMFIPAFVKQVPIKGRLSKDMGEWPQSLQVQEYPC